MNIMQINQLVFRGYNNNNNNNNNIMQINQLVLRGCNSLRLLLDTDRQELMIMLIFSDEHDHHHHHDNHHDHHDHDDHTFSVHCFSPFQLENKGR